VTASLASFNFGYNIGSTNLPTPLIKEFFQRRYFNEFSVRNDELEEIRKIIQANKTQVKNDEDKLKINQEALKKEVDGSNNASVINELEIVVKNLEKNIENIKEKLTNQEDNLNKKKPQIENDRAKIEEFNTFLWTITTALFVVGGMIGAFT
jgi:hypothetical protein